MTNSLSTCRLETLTRLHHHARLGDFTNPSPCPYLPCPESSQTLVSLDTWTHGLTHLQLTLPEVQEEVVQKLDAPKVSAPSKAHLPAPEL